MPNQQHAKALQDQYEPRPDPVSLTHNTATPEANSKTNVDYEPHPEHSIQLTPERQAIVTAITNLYSGSAHQGEQRPGSDASDDMRVYAKESIYDDPWSYCDTRYKIAGQWYGIPKAMASSKTLKLEVVASDPDRLVWKQQHEYTPRVLNVPTKINSLVTLTLVEEEGVEKVKYHKDMWNEKDYSHEGLGKVLKELNGDKLTAITRPPDDL